MLTLQQLNRLRGIKTTEQRAEEEKKDNSNANVAVPPIIDSNSVQASRAELSQPKLPEPVEIPCKNYADEDGHFAYIDAETHKIFHVNLDNGKVYTQDEVNQLALQHAIRSLPDSYKSLIWKDVVNNNTLFDMFGCPIFTFDEIDVALQKISNTQNTVSAPNNADTVINEGALKQGEQKTDPWGLPL